ncbi:MAG TPA: diphthine--ammonia ligase [Candidatus Nitrosotenuis sp.]|nr:diphthine--ammonia ligase [Candidatus Nitrosotenuis sp.]
MNLAALFSGGKDSTFAIYEARRLGHVVKCLITILTPSAESHLLHHPNIEITSLQARSMKIPQITIKADSTDTRMEIELIKKALKNAKTEYHVEGVLHGGILSEFQKTKFAEAAKSVNLEIIAPLWQRDQRRYMQEIIESGFEFIITSVSCDGLDRSWLGKIITKKDLEKLFELSEKFGFNVSFEGGEAETFVVNCPLYSAPIKITKSQTHWDGYRGRFQIMRAEIQGNA